MMKCLIIDDEPLAQDILEGYVNADNRMNLSKKCSTAFEAFEILHEQKIDLLFLDVKMPGLNVIDFLRSLKHPPAVIFTTAYSEYAVESYELEAVDYLLKPITQERFDKSMARLFKVQPKEHLDKKDYTYFKVSGKLMKINHTEILYAQSIKDYILLHTILGRYITHMTMKNLVEILPENDFIRIHRSYLVSKDKIGSIGKSHLHIGEQAIPVGKLYKKNLELIS